MTSKTTMKTHGLAALALAGSVALAPAAHAQAADVVASYFGSAGMVQAGTTAPAKTSRAILSTGSTGSVVARYAIAPVRDFMPGVLHLAANMSDPGPGASISISLMELSVGKPGELAALGAAKAILTLSSEDLKAGAFAGQCANDAGGIKLDFESKVYFIQAQLNWDASVQPTAPQLRTIQLVSYPAEVCGGDQESRLAREHLERRGVLHLVSFSDKDRGL
jgi:hypothetical protein